MTPQLIDALVFLAYALGAFAAYAALYMLVLMIRIPFTSKHNDKVQRVIIEVDTKSRQQFHVTESAAISELIEQIREEINKDTRE